MGSGVKLRIVFRADVGYDYVAPTFLKGLFESSIDSFLANILWRHICYYEPDNGSIELHIHFEVESPCLNI